ncbi:hypothetical protein GKZ28_22850 [Clostridium chromiireducens]|uniref:Uncharacterized protein n=1 Tax=Clostridium chromiireducens TaxID=225345 RepID=A0A964W4P4_9CLOT|nr:helix-turn-helix transcriptional regulator [Clostridium chromiireducens]MVX66517.1 hypothetical protein [Clostridium chromiireducens]
MFNAELLSDLIKQAQGDISLNNFARECKISSSTLSRIINMTNSCAPSPRTLQKIAVRAHNGVTYDELMKVAGYIASNEDIKARVETEKHISSVSAEKEIVKIFDDLKKYLLTTDGLMLSGNPLSKEAIESLIETLSYAIKVAKIINEN